MKILSWGVYGALEGFNMPIGTQGELSLGWKEEISISLRSFSNNHIDVDIDDFEIRVKWRLTRFYGALETRGREETWDLLKTLGKQPFTPWLVCGDFNEILYSFKKK
ncbi:reverse transcriptase [Gossypium australe]|uniref:Reverse transcriptase n=1 Tax=Gossypium australe TaxID=47621 RepID=A0A5B6WDB2_9ROSI|nr:reverse transcriptase [Gossypium australe]